jgi:hypothetical protein
VQDAQEGCRKETGACGAAGGRWTATRDHDTESMAEMSGAGEVVDGGAEW